MHGDAQTHVKARMWGMRATACVGAQCWAVYGAAMATYARVAMVAQETNKSIIR